MTARIAKVQVLQTKRNGWPEWAVRNVTVRGGYTDRQTYHTGSEARLAAHRRASVAHVLPVEEVQA